MFAVRDRKLAIEQGTSGVVDYFTSDVVSYSDYYPFGMVMPGRNGSEAVYRYGFQGQESDDEIKGEGNSVNYKYRMHDPRIGRFFAVDPLAASYPWNSPYAFSENLVIHMVELEGLESKSYMTLFSTDGWNSWWDHGPEQEIKSTLKDISDWFDYSTVCTNIIDNLMIVSLKEVAEMKNPNVSKLTEEQKLEVFENGTPSEIVGILLYEFATGTGGVNPRTFHHGSTFAQEIASTYVLSDVKDLLGTMTRDAFNERGKVKGNIDFSPSMESLEDPRGVQKSIFRHAISNESQFFIGGALFSVSTIENDPNHVLITVTNSTSRSSAGYHILDDYPEGSGPLGTTKQVIIFTMEVSDDDFKAPSE